MAGHDFNFDGGDELSKIGASWFVSYSFYIYKDKSHMNWKRIKTSTYRIGVFNRTKNYHEFWLEKILEMNNLKLKTNKLSLDAEKVKEMAKILLTKYRKSND